MALLVVGYPGGVILWFTVQAISWHFEIEESEKSKHAKHALSAPIWPVALVRVIARTISQMRESSRSEGQKVQVETDSEKWDQEFRDLNGGVNWDGSRFRPGDPWGLWVPDPSSSYDLAKALQDMAHSVEKKLEEEGK